MKSSVTCLDNICVSVSSCLLGCIIYTLSIQYTYILSLPICSNSLYCNNYCACVFVNLFTEVVKHNLSLMKETYLSENIHVIQKDMRGLGRLLVSN